MKQSVFLFLFFVLSSCQSHEKKAPKEENFDVFVKPLAKVDASNLYVDLSAEDYISKPKDRAKKIAGLLLKPNLDPQGSYIHYQICPVAPNKGRCIEGKLDGLLPDLIFGAPQGNIQILYKACVIERIALGDPCGAEKSLYAVHKIKDIVPLFLAFEDGESSQRSLQNAVDRLFETVSSYSDPLKDKTNAFDFWIDNFNLIDSSLWKTFLNSSAFIQHVKNFQELIGKTASKGAGGLALLSLGSKKRMEAFFEDWKREQSYESIREHIDLLGRKISFFWMSAGEEEETIEFFVQWKESLQEGAPNFVNKKHLEILEIFSEIEIEILRVHEASIFNRNEFIEKE